MSTTQLIRWSAPFLALGGLCFAVFVFVSNGEFTGAEFGLSMRHRVAHTAHFISALCFLFGVVGFYADQRAASGVFGLVAFVVALTGTALFCATGVITAFVWRTISANAPQLVGEHGAFFEPPLPIIFIATVTFSVGMALLGATALRTKTLPRIAAYLLIAGAALVLAPPPPWGPVPYPVIDAGATLFAVGAICIATVLWRRPTVVVA